MKKIILLTLIVFALNMQAQFTVTKVGTTTQILNNDIITFNSVNDAASALKFNINNTTNSDINMKIRCVSITNATGIGMVFCFAGSCINDVTAATNYPDGRDTSVIPAMGNNGNFDSFKNTNAGNGTSTQDYVFKFYQVDNVGNEIGSSITFTYRYQPVLGTNSFVSLENLGVQLKSNIIENQLVLKSNNDLSFELFDLNGRKLIAKKLISGENTIDVSSLNASIYYLNVIDANGNKATAKIIKR